jgi:hypothetical protein
MACRHEIEQAVAVQFRRSDGPRHGFPRKRQSAPELAIPLVEKERKIPSNLLGGSSSQWSQKLGVAERLEEFLRER